MLAKKFQKEIIGLCDDFPFEKEITNGVLQDVLGKATNEYCTENLEFLANEKERLTKGNPPSKYIMMRNKMALKGRLEICVTIARELNFYEKESFTFFSFGKKRINKEKISVLQKELDFHKKEAQNLARMLFIIDNF